MLRKCLRLVVEYESEQSSIWMMVCRPKAHYESNAPYPRESRLVHGIQNTTFCHSTGIREDMFVWTWIYYMGKEGRPHLRLGKEAVSTVRARGAWRGMGAGRMGAYIYIYILSRFLFDIYIYINRCRIDLQYPVTNSIYIYTYSVGFYSVSIYININRCRLGFRYPVTNMRMCA